MRRALYVVYGIWIFYWNFWSSLIQVSNGNLKDFKVLNILDNGKNWTASRRMLTRRLDFNHILILFSRSKLYWFIVPPGKVSCLINFLPRRYYYGQWTENSISQLHDLAAIFRSHKKKLHHRCQAISQALHATARHLDQCTNPRLSVLSSWRS